MREATYRTVYPVSARQYYDLMLSSAFQRAVHVDGLHMSVWDNVDEYSAPRRLRRRVYSEPSLKLPKWMARFARKSQAYTEYSEFCPETLTRRTRVVPKIGANLMEFVVEERYENVEGSVVGKMKKGTRASSSSSSSSSCVVVSVVRIRSKLRLFRNLFEKWILEQSEVKVRQRDEYVLRALEARVFDELLAQEDTASGVEVEEEGSGRMSVPKLAATVALAVATRLASRAATTRRRER